MFFTHANYFWQTLFLAIFLLMVAGCGGGSDPSGSVPATNLFVAENVWQGVLPSDVETVTPDEFKRREVIGDLSIVTTETQQNQQFARAQKITTELAFLDGIVDASEDVKALIQSAHAANEFAGDAVVTLPQGQQVSLNSLGTRILEAAENYRLAHDSANALASYTLSYSLLTADQKSGLLSPEMLTNSTLDQIQQATQQLNTLLGESGGLDNTRLDSAPQIATVQALNPGNGTDSGGSCAATGYVKRYWFPLRSFVSPVKDQGKRGTCWAFTAAATVESRERVQNNNAIDISEQFIINKVKREWFASDFDEGGSAPGALNAAVDRNQTLMPEANWTYNRALGRPANAFDADVVDTANSFKGACGGYTGFCSETAHESAVTCTKYLGMDYCAYNKMNFNGPGVSASRARLLWTAGDNFNLNQYRALLASGVSLIASFPVYDGFRSAPATGIVSDYSKKMRNKKNELVNGDYGGHVTQIVGFISNEQLSFPGSPVNIGGGGYFIIRNSWGCAADGGYFYVPADYVSSLFSSLSVLDFDARRSARWEEEQVTPGATSALSVDPKGTGVADLRITKNIADTFSVTHPVANYAQLIVTSDRDGMLYNGQWLLNPPIGGSLFANALWVTFATEGTRVLTITARYGSQVVTASKEVIVLNSAPSVRLEGSGLPQQGENFVVNAIVSDVNETNLTGMCNTMTWNVSAPDEIVSGSGCTRVVRFGSAGDRDIQVSTKDSEGRAGSAIKTFTVSPPPVNPYPRVTAFGVYSRDIAYLGGIASGCKQNLVATNTDIDLRQIGCKLTVFGADRSRYLAQIAIENPTAETLSYDWTFAMYYANSVNPNRADTTHTTTPSFDMNAIVFGARDTAYTCTVDVRVNAPDVSRNKSQRVWTGRCINIEDAPR